MQIGEINSMMKEATGLAGLSYLRTGIRFGTNLALARLLSPEVFGELALAVSIFAFFNLASRWGTPEAIMQREEEEIVPTIFTLRTLYSLLLALAVLIASYFLSNIYSPRISLIFLIIGLTSCFGIFGNVFKSVLQKQMKLRLLGVMELIGTLLAAITAVTSAFFGFGVWSLVIFNTLGKFIYGAGVIYFSPFRGKFKLSRQVVRWYFNFGKKIFVSSSISKFENKADDFLVGSFLGTATLGFYSMAWKLARTFNQMVMSPINQAILPSFAKLKGNQDKITKSYEFLMRNTLRLLVPFCFLLAFFAPQALEIIFGAKWLPAAPILRVQVPYTLIIPLFGIHKQIHNALGHPENYLHSKYVTLIIFVSTVGPLLIFLGAVGVALSLDVAFAAGLILLILRLKKRVDFHLNYEVVSTLISLSIAIGALFGSRSLLGSLSPTLSYIVLIAIFGLTYILALIALQFNTMRQDFLRVQRGFKSS